MISILFVDEDQNVLDGIKRTFFRFRRVWNMQFVNSGEMALEKMAMESFEVIVSAVDMSGINGSELLRIVKESHPEVGRIMISDNANMDDLLESVGVAHQVLLKPVSATVLKNTLHRVINLREYLTNKKIKQIINQIVSLPTQPECYLELSNAIPFGSIKEIANIIKKDLSMTTKILQLVNSPFFGLKVHINEIEHAVNLIGVDIIRALILTLEIFSKFKVKGKSLEELNNIFYHSCDVANYSRIIAYANSKENKIANDSYLCGLLHDVGKLIILSEFKEEYFRIKQILKEDKKLSYQVENDLMGVNHSQLGAYLLGLWGLPDFLVEAAAYHHVLSNLYLDGFSPLVAVHIADAMKRSEIDGFIPDFSVIKGLNLNFLNQLDRQIVIQIPSWIEIININRCES